MTTTDESSAAQNTPTATTMSSAPSAPNPPILPLPLRQRVSRARSDVWEHFTKFIEDGEVKGKCNYCPKTYLCDSKRYGTSTLKNHMTHCIHNPLKS